VADLDLTYAGREYDRTRALRDGKVRVEGVDLRYVELMVNELFWRMARYADFDVSEMSLSTYLLTRDREATDLVAIPVFPARAFRHNMIFVNSGAGIQRAEELKGRRIGIPEYQMTAALWLRGLLQDEFGVHPRDVTWVRGPHTAGGHAEERVPWLPADVTIEPAPAGRGIDDMLERGEIDAIISAVPPAGARRRSDSIRPLFADSRAVAEDYFRRTGLFPIMHTIVIRGDIYRAHRWTALNLFKAFSQAKVIAYRTLREATPRMSVPFLLEEVTRQEALFGPDPYPYGIPRNRHALETGIRYSYEQGLTSRLWSIEELFAPETLEEEETFGLY
jgi:4,5-dihydroxyphthalate decarboxylase